ncbi:SDR family oxidoreductase [Phytoactinopolyspora limicola]|uniref:SDR family oxidoreductase n=1 Tax=Phytoactinopolyspora limicola TaxID=2715536 RepID=UPI00140CFB4B|nr:NAD(P)H-binding protein [Phytoactinopolyspora limicola]
MSVPGTILVTGATGHVGRHVVTGLVAAGADVRAVVRHPERAQLPTGVDVVPGDLTQPDTLDTALDGVGSIFLIWPLLSADAAPPTVARLTKAARRVVFLSALEDAANQRPTGFWGEVEELIEQSGVEWTFLRASGFTSNTLEWAQSIRTDGVVRAPYGAARRSLVHEADLAAVAVHALLEDHHVGRAYPLTGPEHISQVEQVRTIGEAIGRPVRWEEMSRDAAERQYLAEWGDPEFVQAALDAWASMVENPEPLTNEIEAVTGAPARTYRQWAVEHAAAFR